VAGRGAPAADAAVPPDLVQLGIVRGAYGVRGWVRIDLFGSEGALLLAASRWWLQQDRSVWAVLPTARRRHRSELLGKWPGCDTKEAADALKGVTVCVPRSEFPPLLEGEYYWFDLPGCRVVDREGKELGEVTGLRENAGGQWLEVEDGRGAGVILIPLVEQYVEAVELDQRVIRVDWKADWS
jgi:16S rRNA processing protein RimM